MIVKNYYKLLNIDSKSDLDTIKQTFRKKIALYHPDKNKSPEATQKFEDLIEGFDILSQEDKRKTYDDLLQKSLNQKLIVVENEKDVKQEQQYKTWQKEAKTKSKKYRSSTLEDLLLLDLFFVGGDVIDDIFDGVGDIMGDIFDLL